MLPNRNNIISGKANVKKAMTGSRRNNLISTHVNFDRPRICSSSVAHLSSGKRQENVFESRLFGLQVAKPDAVCCECASYLRCHLASAAEDGKTLAFCFDAGH